MVFNTVKVLLCEVLLVVTYPPYFYVFTTLSKTGQMLFAALLPVIKLVMRNIFNMTVVHLSDEMPEVVVFNSEVFNALFVSYCMQSSPSFGTTLMVTAALLVQLAMSLRDVNIAVHRTELVGSHLTGEHGGPYQLIAKSSIGCCKPSTLECAYTLLRCGAVQNATKRMSKIHVVSIGSKLDVKDFKLESRGTLQLSLQPIGAQIHPEPDAVKVELAKPKRESQEMSATSLQYVLEVRRLMNLTEFLVLIYYVGVFIPLIFCKYPAYHTAEKIFLRNDFGAIHEAINMGAMYRLTNRAYYAQLADLTEAELEKALINVMFNCGLKLVSLVLLCAVLQYRLRFSAIHQLAFVLDKQWPGVQTKICFWVFYNVQASLQHLGSMGFSS
ncbi:hypothetical protein PF001_g20553 [Phytophthora fragariae]|uniref:Uncharacterized protein n=1 Tax=Phytophthora fragariae TaxID=53985 RepID=A0A6A3EKG2_9STRA|nr:hypothetical protein PF009_g15838 [Phytophthora fragariae]KAE9219397.1 hypothetical protein PF004_g13622 [Phytophthora fragariae]KAE9288360.1 hypothetical protein PF001_g20553 [Phytophthora fragariae]